MIEIKAILRQETDLWPLQEAGIPVRLLTTASREGLQTLADLRNRSDKDLLALRGIGERTVREWRAYLRSLNDLERGKLRFQDLSDVLHFFLSEPEQEILVRRYGLLGGSGGAEPVRMTLQEIGATAGLTRERVRQMEDAGLTRLSSRMAQACLEPVYRILDALLCRLSHVMEPADFAVWRDQTIWGGLSPCGIARLLNDLRPSPWTFHRGYWSSLSQPQLLAVERGLVKILHALGRPANTHRLAEQTAETLARFQPKDVQRLIEVILRHCPGVRRTPDGSFFAA
jgi:hypothetical protein